MRLSELCRGADPARTDDKKNLREDEITQTERLFERFAARFDLFLSALEFSSHRSSVEAVKRWMVAAVSCCHVERSGTSLVVTAPAVERNSQRFFASLRMTMAFPF